MRRQRRVRQRFRAGKLPMETVPTDLSPDGTLAADVRGDLWFLAVDQNSAGVVVERLPSGRSLKLPDAFGSRGGTELSEPKRHGRLTRISIRPAGEFVVHDAVNLRLGIRSELYRDCPFGESGAVQSKRLRGRPASLIQAALHWGRRLSVHRRQSVSGLSDGLWTLARRAAE